MYRNLDIITKVQWNGMRLITQRMLISLRLMKMIRIKSTYLEYHKLMLLTKLRKKSNKTISYKINSLITMDNKMSKQAIYKKNNQSLNSSNHYKFNKIFNKNNNNMNQILMNKLMINLTFKKKTQKKCFMMIWIK